MSLSVPFWTKTAKLLTSSPNDLRNCWLTLDDLCALHKDMMRDYCQESLLEQPDVLASALYAPLAAFGENELCPTNSEKLVRLTDGISRAQAFSDGHKRLALAALEFMLAQLGMELKASQEERAHWVKFDLSTETPEDTQKAVTWLKSNVTRI